MLFWFTYTIKALSFKSVWSRNYKNIGFVTVLFCIFIFGIFLRGAWEIFKGVTCWNRPPPRNFFLKTEEVQKKEKRMRGWYLHTYFSRLRFFWEGLIYFHGGLRNFQRGLINFSRGGGGGGDYKFLEELHGGLRFF